MNAVDALRPCGLREGAPSCGTHAAADRLPVPRKRKGSRYVRGSHPPDRRPLRLVVTRMGAEALTTAGLET
jgi:hypothetical protein